MCDNRKSVKRAFLMWLFFGFFFHAHYFYLYGLEHKNYKVLLLDVINFCIAILIFITPTYEFYDENNIKTTLITIVATFSFFIGFVCWVYELFKTMKEVKIINGVCKR